MTGAGRSIFYFGFWVLACGITLMFFPAFCLEFAGIALNDYHGAPLRHGAHLPGCIISSPGDIRPSARCTGPRSSRALPRPRRHRVCAHGHGEADSNRFRNGGRAGSALDRACAPGGEIPDTSLAEAQSRRGSRFDFRATKTAEVLIAWRVSVIRTVNEYEYLQWYYEVMKKFNHRNVESRRLLIKGLKRLMLCVSVPLW